MSPLRLLARAAKTAVLWYWIFNVLRLSSSILLLPLLLGCLSKADLGMYFVLVALTQIVPVLDFGLAPNVQRNVAYAMAGAKELQALGMSETPGTGTPNIALLWSLFRAVRSLYRRLAVVGFLILGAVGTWAVSVHVAETTWPAGTWLAWFISLVAVVSEIYLGWWTNFLIGMNQPLSAARFATAGYSLNLLLACILLKTGFGLLSVPIASLVSSLLQRSLNRNATLKIMGKFSDPGDGSDVASLLKTLWPNIWRMGCLLLANYVVANLIVFIPMFGLAINAEYGLSVRLITAVQTISAIWVYVKWPRIAQLNNLGEVSQMGSILRPRFWLQTLTFFSLSACVLGLGPLLLHRYFPDKQLLPLPWLGLLVLNAFFQMSFTFWTTLLWMQNRIPSFIPTIITQIATLGLLTYLIAGAKMGAVAFILAPLACGAAFNYWFWWSEGARMLRTTVRGFLFRKAEGGS
jgi:hypothetical protein